MSTSNENNEISASIEELFVKQIFDDEDVDKIESLTRGDILSGDDTDSQLYDRIVQKLIDNPKINKKTLMQRFISRIEMESNNAGAMNDELNQIKKFVQGFAGIKEKDGKLLNETINAEEQFYSDDDAPDKFNPMHSISED